MNWELRVDHDGQAELVANAHCKHREEIDNGKVRVQLTHLISVRVEQLRREHHEAARGTVLVRPIAVLHTRQLVGSNDSEVEVFPLDESSDSIARMAKRKQSTLVTALHEGLSEIDKWDDVAHLTLSAERDLQILRLFDAFEKLGSVGVGRAVGEVSRYFYEFGRTLFDFHLCKFAFVYKI